MAKKQSLAVQIESMEVNDEAKFQYGYMTTMVTISRIKKEFGNANRKFAVLKIDEKNTSVKRIK